jgi:4,5-dihydroxyphthalate decarboxylase
LPEYQLTANVWARAILEDHGVKPADVTWVRGGIDEPGRPEKIAITLAPDIRIENAPDGETISGLIDKGAIDGFMAPRPPSCAGANPNVGWLFADPVAAASAYYKRTGIFPIMHAVGVRRALAERHPWLPAAVLKAFAQAKAIGLAQLADTSAPKVTLPFVDERLKAAQALMGSDFWSYGIAANRATLETFLRYHHGQGLSSRLLSVEELFHPATHETAKV